MDSLLNATRPPVFCPGCSHERITHTLDQAFRALGLSGAEICMVSDIGCSGLFDTFFHTHALHGLHGRALTYAAGIKLARPELNVVVTMGDGGQGIGGAHLLAACRRNLDLTLLVLNNFNFGMTGGQYSATTPPEAQVGSGFLNRLERPLDIAEIARAAGAPYVVRCSAYRGDLSAVIAQAMAYKGFSVVDIWGICPGRFSKRNRLTPKLIEEMLARHPVMEGEIAENRRPEYGASYREIAAGLRPVAAPEAIEPRFAPAGRGREEVILLGSAGQRILTAGELLCLAGAHAGLHTTQKNDYDITVLRGPSISELILSPEPIGFSGIARPSVVVALGPEGVARRRKTCEGLTAEAVVIQAAGVDIPAGTARTRRVDFKAQGIKPPDWALAALGVMAKLDVVMRPEMLEAALAARLKGESLAGALELVRRVETGAWVEA
ncbi:MAG: thiamine pyrophosphate-dependent enzyme [Desulfobacterales bacterium]|jgi:pyruvate/2-oxoacid:ferredoxin oxidoreductase beta subunit/Pyruvate/2-oxoacid:ferredoxin oxidoreductase gamma subunit|nr:thiamine pyrophosphate-dependent enzyme [Desulfobacterales bacterium]